MISVKQRQLNLKHYYLCYEGKIDGIVGNQTKKAYQTFQKKTGIQVDGIYGPETNNKLIEVIKDLQTKLNREGYTLVVDGYVGTNTIQAIKQFQNKEGLIVDGIAGQYTFQRLKQTKKLDWSNINYFKKEEFTCSCSCKLNNINMELVQILDDIRKYFGKPAIITSGCRCEKHNKKVGGVQGSRHIQGKAADFYIQGVGVKTVLQYTKQLEKKGIIRYTYTNNTNMSGAVHIDIK